MTFNCQPPPPPPPNIVRTAVKSLSCLCSVITQLKVIFYPQIGCYLSCSITYTIYNYNVTRVGAVEYSYTDQTEIHVQFTDNVILPEIQDFGVSLGHTVETNI